MSLAPILTAYLQNHIGIHFTDKETPISSPLQFLLEHAYEQQKISKRNNHSQVAEAAVE